MNHFIKPVDSLSRLIEEKAQLLYQQLDTLPLEELKFSPAVDSYYKNHHDKRKFFSVQTAAELLYRSIKLKGKALEDVTVMDYGAGVGSLYLLAKMIGCKKVVYNDILNEMADAGEKIAKFLDVNIDLYIVADHTNTIQQLNANHIFCDIILSRNVVEHIYDLNDFYKKMSEGQPNALIYFSTTANYHNPAMLWYHKRIHKKYEPGNLAMRKKLIIEKLPNISNSNAENLSKATRGLAMYDFDEAIENYKTNDILPNPEIHYTNTCDPYVGLWQEHIIPVNDYKKIIESKGYKLTILPAFWDTHYNNFIKNIVGKTMNRLTKLLGQKGGLTTTAFIYVIAEKK